MRILFIIFVSLISSSPALSELIEPPEEQLNAFTQALGIEKTSSLSIKEAVYFVLSQHPSVKNALGFEERAKEIINISKSRYYPQISGGISSSYDRYRTGRYQNKYLQDMELNVEQMLYDFGKTSNSVKKSEYGSFKTKARTQLIVERLIEEVSRTVIEIVRYQNLTRLAQKLAQEITGLTILVEKRHAKGASTLSDVLQARSRKDSAKTLIIESRAQHKQWLQQLALLTNVQMLVYASLKDFPVELEKSCQFKDIKWDLVPEVVMADMAAEEASVDMELAKAQEWPTLLLQAGIARRDKFNRYGQLAVTQYLGEKERVLKEDCYTPSGLFCISRVFDANTRKLNLIQWFDHASGECFIFYKEEELAGEWLKRRFFDEGNIFFIDKHRSWSKPLNDLNKVIPQRIISVIHSIHISDPYEDVKEGRLNSNYRNILNSTIPVERCIVLTPHQKEDIHHRFKDTSYKLNCIPHSLTIPNIFPIFEERDPNLLVAAIRLSKEKRIEDMLHIMRLVSEYHPEKRLEIYGEGPDKKKIQALIKELEIENFVIVKGYRQDIDKIFSRAAISLLTSRIEGFSLATLESLAQGCPVLSYDIKYGPASMIIHEHNGWLIENGNIESAAKILISIFNTPQKLKAISRNAYVSTRKFSSELIASRWASVLGLVQ